MTHYVIGSAATLCAVLSVVGFAERGWGETPKASPSSTPSASQPHRAASARRRAKALAAPESTKDAVGISFEQLEFEFAKGADYKPESLPEPVRKLLNKKVRIRGYMWPDVLYDKGNTQFILVRSDKSSGAFVSGPELCENIVVKMQEGKTVDFTMRPITVEGMLTFRVERFPDEPPTSVLRIVADSAEPPQKK
jgi:hypothetical protein